MKIYTKTGDDGTTSLLGGKRVSKSELRINTYGTVDELNAYLGLLRDQEVNKSRKDVLVEIQNNLFTIGAMLATDPAYKQPKIPTLSDDDVVFLEKEMDSMDQDLPTLRFFVLPGGHQSVSTAHIVRTVCRRAERLTIALNAHEKVDPVAIKYLNRLSDYFFVLSRKIAQELGSEEIAWKPDKD
jgi:cob(I)alamin adenosyltransferase